MLQTQLDVNNLERLYELRGRETVLNFLTPTLMEGVLAVYDKIRHYFPDAHLSLAVVSDIEEPNHVLLHLRIDSDFDDDVERIDSIVDEWWITTPAEVRAKLLIIPDYTHN